MSVRRFPLSRLNFYSFRFHLVYQIRRIAVEKTRFVTLLQPGQSVVVMSQVAALTTDVVSNFEESTVALYYRTPIQGILLKISLRDIIGFLDVQQFLPF